MNNYIKKELYAREDCPKCGIRICCRYSKKSHKLQWQNDDGGPHFGYDDGNFFCKDPDEYVMKCDGAQKECDTCGTVLHCRLKKYKNYPDSLQWQNKNGNAHYLFIDDGEYACNIEVEEEN